MAIEVYPVVHINEESQAVDQALSALDVQADGVYLIDHKSIDARPICRVFNNLSRTAPNSFIGINILQILNSIEAFQLIHNMSESGELNRLPDGLWVDDATDSAFATEVYRARHKELKSVLYLGGIAFKYTKSYTDNPTVAAEIAKKYGPFMDVVTTTGGGTGRAATIEKVTAMKLAISPQKLALASGVSINNISAFANVADQALVATSVETYPGSGEFNLPKLVELITAAHD